MYYTIVTRVSVLRFSQVCEMRHWLLCTQNHMCFDLFTIRLWLRQSPFPCDQQNKNCLKCSKQSRCHPDASFFECGLNFKCDPLSQQGPEVAGDNTSYRQTSEGQMVFHSTVPLQLTKMGVVLSFKIQAWFKYHLKLHILYFRIVQMSHKRSKIDLRPILWERVTNGFIITIIDQFTTDNLTQKRQTHKKQTITKDQHADS